MSSAKVLHQPHPTGAARVVSPPAPPGESAPEAVHKTQAVADALVQLGEQADAKRVAVAVKAQTGIDLDAGEVAAIMEALRERAAGPPSVDQPPPENARRPGEPADEA
jgi:hypothetical protein